MMHMCVGVSECVCVGACTCLRSCVCVVHLGVTSRYRVWLMDDNIESVGAVLQD